MAKKEEGKKKMGKKLKPQKLEERIAPGMLGGGVVDPGMADGMTDQPTDAPTDPNAGDVQQTSIDQSSPDQTTHDQGGQYSEEKLDQPTGDNPPPYEGQEAPQEGPGYQTLDSGAPQGGDYVSDETPTWRETDFVTANADGSIHIAPPEGVSIDDGIASFPVDVANQSLPLPEGAEIQTDGSMNVALPEGSTFNADSGLLTMPEGSINLQEVPQGVEAFANPDGSISVQLPEEGMTYLPDSNMINIDNATLNDMAPNNVEIATDGSVNVTLPEETQVHADGSVDLPPESASFMDNPPPPFVDNIDWATVNTDGSVTCTCPDGVTIDDGVATFSPEMASEQLPIPDDVTINSDGTIDVKVPEGTSWDADAGSLTFPEGAVKLDEIPEGVSAHINPDGTITAVLPDGMNYSPETASVHMDNVWANEFAPDPVAINLDGSVSVELPQNTQFTPDGTGFTLPPEQVNFVDTPAPDYVHDVDFSISNGDGSYTVTPPEGAVITANTMEMPYNVVAEAIPLPEDMTLHADGTMEVKVPEGTLYNAVEGALTFPEGTVHMNDFPPGVDASLNADGTITATLPDGINYDAASGSVQMDNYWTNEVMPSNVEFTESGVLKVDLPQNVEFHNDGTFTLPPQSADFIENPPPPYVSNGPDWVTSNPGDSITVVPPAGMQVDPQAGTFSMPADTFQEHFDNYVPEDMKFNPDGTADIKVPEGTQFNAESGTLTLPAGEVHMNEIPEGIEAQLNDDGSISVKLPDGMDFNPDTGSVHMDNYWVNEMAPPPVEFTMDGQCKIDLPQGTQYYEGGGFTVPADSANFIDSPAPPYIANGPEWVDYNPDGSFTCEPPQNMVVNPDAGTATMPADAFQEHFAEQMPPDLTMNADGTADIKVPEGTQYSADSGTLTFPEGQVHMNEIPPGIEASLNENGTISVKLPEGMEYNPDSGSVHMSNEWINHFAPEPMHIQPDGQVVITLPEGTQHFEGGAFTVPADQAGFMEEYKPYEGAESGPQFQSAAG